MEFGALRQLWEPRKRKEEKVEMRSSCSTSWRSRQKIVFAPRGVSREDCIATVPKTGRQSWVTFIWKMVCRNMRDWHVLLGDFAHPLFLLGFYYDDKDHD